MERVVVIDYGSGNLHSAAKALERAARDNGIPAEIDVSNDAEVAAAADRLVLPGVGAFADCWQGLNALPGVVEALGASVLEGGRPFLGICVGMQLMATCGREYGTTPGLDWIPGEVVALAPDDPHLRIPHMGWNELAIRQPDHPVLAGIESGAHAYFVHSYQFAAGRPEHVLAVTDYGGEVTAVVGRDNLVGTQFHPEKSQATGLRLLGNFLRWRP
ncbi:imidazole glycerol phosphate synthase subunit HisH [Ferruginivarius sediminum]|uniref:Imidazole glycerol phosphate synthase subunit HisH n=1 Tax=Ferruginivarius sediminum TaxID=2661937 RepID=A0A369TEM2_9PROT|nr:imidazole glycerol phosphate synthase subunit HisH [Ferruginivarius sediminum]RDD63292.1 imidazole glycerol phosphate synthase subunit HisH [Ferruginivarius sediminum]